ncbi:putative inactive glutathione hydrolase 4 [Turnera subulata]|uniref:Inactive glutathione hydrolase 4 n=1 Tax=Turnera subulata TaxID=218843 RepID=A0A9Q0JHN6_9ROSI|nr:putative inactive glutathione hydrolase 4 [Turnera subulata]
MINLKLLYVGASGGGMIIAGTTKVILNYFVEGLDPLSSGLAARVYHQRIPDVVQMRNGQQCITTTVNSPLT